MAPNPTTLVGPPQIPLSSSTIVTPAVTNTNTTTQNNPKSSSSRRSFPPRSPYSTNPTMGLTETDSPCYLTSGNPCLDFFFHVVPDSPPEDIVCLLDHSWKHDPLITLKLVCNLRGVRGTGKADKKGFYTAALWLHEHHPKTLALNMKSISSFGYLKDMPEILFRLIEGSDVRDKSHRNNFYEFTPMFSSRLGRRNRRCYSDSSDDDEDSSGDDEDDEKEQVRGRARGKGDSTKSTKEDAKVLRLQRKNERAKKAIERYNQDSNFRVLYDSISDIFGVMLKNDVELLSKNTLYDIGFAAKYCPSLDSTYDQVTLLCESIARRVFPRDEFEEYKETEEAHYAYQIRDRLRKEVLVPLRKALELPEVYMSLKKWDALPYNRVPSVAMKLYKTLFMEHDQERFEGYLEKVKAGKATIAAGALLPHEIIASLSEAPEVAELQWKKMVDDLTKKGKLNNCMAICDTSGSMYGTPMEVSVALGLLISELSDAPWKGKLITFSQEPTFHTVKGDTLKCKTDFIRNMNWGLNTDFQKVFDRILEVAVKAKIPEDQMVQRLFVFSDMEFDEASATPWETDYVIVQRKFKESGYERVPEIVFWNLRHSRAIPVPSTQAGVALVSGFSKNLVTLFLEEGGILNPEAVMMQAIAKPEYSELVVYD